jgi:hypothetical protein
MSTSIGDESLSQQPYIDTKNRRRHFPDQECRHSLSRDVFLDRLLRNTASSVAGTFSLATFSSTSSTTTSTVAYAFEGGVGGLGKTKPQTGVVLWDDSSPPFQDKDGYISTEIQSIRGTTPIRVAFTSPFPLSSTSGGLEVRDVRSTESGYVFVLPNDEKKSTDVLDDTKAFRDVLIETVFSSQGKYGAYSTPTDISVKKLVLPSSVSLDDGSSGTSSNERLFAVTFTTLTPAMRESERQVYIKVVPIQDTSVCFIVGTTKARFNDNKSTFEKRINSFIAVEAPKSKLRRTTTMITNDR